MDEVDKAVEEVMEQVSEVGDDTGRFSQEQSADFYDSVAQDCVTRARCIRDEMEEG